MAPIYLSYAPLLLAAIQHINPKVSRTIESMKTVEEAQNFLGVAHSIRAERAAELAVLEQQLEQCRQEIRILESKMMAARGRVVDADRGIVAMRQLMLEKGIPLVSPEHAELRSA